jgi:hypothetical protein
VPGWTGAGYILFNSQTGDGAFKIGGGQNGAFIIFLSLFLFVAIPLLPLFAAATATIPMMVSLLAFSTGSLFVGISWTKFAQSQDSVELCQFGLSIILLSTFGVDMVAGYLLSVLGIYIGIKAGTSRICGTPPAI